MRMIKEIKAVGLWDWLWFCVYMRMIKEIKAVGLWDWLWFCVYLRRNEFSPKLGIRRYFYRYYRGYGYDDYTWLKKLSSDRNRAHEILNKLDDLKWK